MKSKVRASTYYSKPFYKLFDGEETIQTLLSERNQSSLVRASHSSVEDDVSDIISRECNPCEKTYNGATGSRIGYSPIWLKSQMRRLHSRPRSRHVYNLFLCRLQLSLSRMGEAFQTLAVHFKRDIKRLLQHSYSIPLNSRSNTREFSKTRYADIKSWQCRSLGYLDVVYLFGYGVYESFRTHTEVQKQLGGWCLCSNGRLKIKQLQARDSESRLVRKLIFEVLKDRGMKETILNISEDVKKLEAPIEPSFPVSSLRLFFVQKMPLLPKIFPSNPASKSTPNIWAIFYTPSREVALVHAKEFTTRFDKRFGNLSKKLGEDHETNLAYLYLPVLHYPLLHTRNQIEMILQELMRNTKVFFSNKNARDGFVLLRQDLLLVDEQCLNGILKAGVRDQNKYQEVTRNNNDRFSEVNVHQFRGVERPQKEILWKTLLLARCLKFA